MANFGEVLRAVGDFGLFQKLIILALSFPHLLLSVSFASILFVDSDPERHCNTDWILAAAPNLTAEEQLNLTVPREPDGSFSRCLMFAPVHWSLDAIRTHGLSNRTVACRDGWVYDQSLYKATIVTDVSPQTQHDTLVLDSVISVTTTAAHLMTAVCSPSQFDLVCDKAHLAGIAQTVYMGGILAGSFLFGPASEPLGRRVLTQIPICLLLVFTVVSAMSVNLYMYLAAQFMVGVSTGSEWLGISKRSYSPCVNQLLSSIGQCVTAGLMFGVRDWRLALYILSGPVALVFIYICLSLNVGNFGLNIFVLQSMFGLSQVPAQLLCFFMLEMLGRKKSILCTTITGSLAVGLCAIMVRVAGLLSPLLNLLSVFHWSIPIVVFSSFTLVGGALTLMLPETRGTELADSAAQSDDQRHVAVVKKGDPNMPDQSSTKL
ncbi:hypothetical protein CRUP_037033 [Coryphaenoides rupestris]|nr:hypothetical protein CRUP_037033 [Coryphaenoides rupestris]